MGFSINRDTSKASSIGSVRCKASDRSNTCCLTRSDNEADDRTNRGFAVKEVYRGSLIAVYKKILHRLAAKSVNSIAIHALCSLYFVSQFL